MNDGDGGVEQELGFGLIALLPIACCVGLPLIVATGISVAGIAWAGGIALGVAAFAAAVVLLSTRARTRRRSGSFASPPGRQVR